MLVRTAMGCRRQRHRARVAIVLLLSATVASGTLAGAGTLPPRREDALLRWLREGRYRDVYAAEPAPHPSVSAHGMSVRTYFSPRLVEDLRGGRTRFRKGTAMVKELYFGGDEVVGWSVMRKLRRRSRGGRSWIFYETFDGTAQSAIFGRGVSICVGCHRQGADFLLSPFRP